MKFTKTPLESSYLINLDPIADERGFFSRLFCENEFSKHNLNTHWVQINNSFSIEKSTLRGLHFQYPPNAEVKLVRCIKGSIFDVIVDIRKSSNTFGKWFGAILDETNRTMMYIPKGFAHGFISLEPNSEILYFVSEFYSKENEETILWNDPNIDIKWPIKPIILSDKDSKAKRLNQILPITI